MAILPEEIIEEILSRLPAKLLLRFSIVCKRWLSLISDSNFVRKNLTNILSDQSNRHQRLVWRTRQIFSFQSCDDVDGRAIRRKFPFQDPLGLHLVGSINGLLCISFCIRLGSASYKDCKCYIVLWNPLLNCWNKLPYPTNYSLVLSLGIGFGYDSYVDDYKVVQVSRHGNKVKAYKVEIYTVKTNTWKTILLPMLQDGVKQDQHFKGICVGGSVYWIVYRYKFRFKSIMCFDLINEKLKFLELPPTNSGTLTTTQLMDVKGVLGVLHTSYHAPEECLWVSYHVPEVRLWTIKEEDDGKIIWSEKMVIDHGKIIWSKKIVIDHKFDIPISVMNNGELLMRSRDSSRREHNLILYDVEKKTYNFFSRYDPDLETILEVTKYMETLVSPYG